jgi:hypothetical protein
VLSAAARRHAQCSHDRCGTRVPVAIAGFGRDRGTRTFSLSRSTIMHATHATTPDDEDIGDTPDLPPPDDGEDLPELPNPTEVGEDG